MASSSLPTYCRINDRDLMQRRYFSVDVLGQISDHMRGGEPRPALPKDQENRFREAARMYVEKFGEALDLPPPSDPRVRRRSAKFVGIKNCVRPKVVSGLRWRSGFGWIAVALLALAIAVAVLTSGAARIIAAAAALLVSIFIAYFFLHHEILEWSLLRASGLAGRSAWFGLVVDSAAGFGGWFGYVMLVAYGYDHSWITAIVLYVICLATAPLHMITGSLSMRAKTNTWLMMLPIFYTDLAYLASNLSWFGLR